MMSDSDSGTVLIDKNSEKEPTDDSPKTSEKTKTNFDEGLENTIKWYLHNTAVWKDISTDTLNSTPWKN